MKYTIKSPQSVSGRIVLPSSKSISNRALVINALSGSESPVDNVSDCDDTNVMIKWLGARPDTIDIGAAGTAMRFSTAMLAVTEGTHVITGTERMRNRPIGVLVDALRTLGADVEYVEKEGYPPLRITGNPNLRGGAISLAGNVSSQYISALLMIGPKMSEGLQLKLTGSIISRPYIDMTLSIMREFGADAEWQAEDSIIVRPQTYKSLPYYVESDWSAASYWYEIVALAPNSDARVTLPGLFAKSLQGDCRGADIFKQLGVDTLFEGNDVTLAKNGQCVSRIEANLVEMPDLAQTIVVTCCMLGVPFHFTGLQSLKIKETDRIEALKTELKKLGFVITDYNDSELAWDGARIDADASMGIDTYEDHRMAMAFAPTALICNAVTINDPHVVSKSYPRFWQDLASVGFTVQD